MTKTKLKAYFYKCNHKNYIKRLIKIIYIHYGLLIENLK